MDLKKSAIEILHFSTKINKKRPNNLKYAIGKTSLGEGGEYENRSDTLVLSSLNLSEFCIIIPVFVIFYHYLLFG